MECAVFDRMNEREEKRIRKQGLNHVRDIRKDYD